VTIRICGAVFSWFAETLSGLNCHAGVFGCRRKAEEFPQRSIYRDIVQ